MCLSIPGRIVEISGSAPLLTAQVDFGGAVKSGISLLFCPDAKISDYCLVHAGSALQVVDEKEAEKTIEYMKGMR